jgi:hypothetical protein
MSHWRRWLAVGAGVVVIALVLWLPGPKRPSNAGANQASGGPSTLSSVWPGAHPFAIQATFPDGSAYTPAVVLDENTSVGVIASADGQRTDLALVPASGPPRVLQSQSVTDGGSFDGITASADRVYWMHTISDASGHAQVSLWTAPRIGGSSARLVANVGAPVFFGSEYDVQVVGDRLEWAASRPGQPNQTELRSIPLAGGPVATQVVPGTWALSRWPWLVTAPSATDQPSRLRNVETGAETTVRVPPNKQVTCSPVWCRMIPNNAAEPTETDLIRPDGSDKRVVGDAKAAAIASDVALRDRFEVLMTMVTTTGRLAVSKLALYDIAARRTVQIDGAATNAGARGDFLWWSTGDNETLAWHGLDLRTLT